MSLAGWSPDAERHAAALDAAEARLRADGGDEEALAHAVAAAIHLADYARAIAFAERLADASPDNLVALDALAHAHGALGDADRSRAHGLRALALRDASVPPAAESAWTLPAVPPPFDAAQPGRNAIAFSLYGDACRYCEQAVLNAQDVPRLYPGWHARFYVDETVPDAVRDRLRAAGALVLDVPSQALGLPGTMWRFLACDDPCLDRVLLRDADSPLFAREAGAVAQWLASDRFFHAMRDWGSHTELLLAGLWGVARGGMPPVAAAMPGFARARPAGRYADQHFLREHVWPHARRSLLQHDSVFGFLGARAFPDGPRPPDRHVGMGPLAVEIAAAFADGARVAWVLEDADGREICRYRARVAQGRVRDLLPHAYCAGLVEGRLSMRVVAETPPNAAVSSPALNRGEPMATFYVPVYNGERHLADAIESVLSQRCGVPFELLLIDDGSSDGSWKLLESALRDRRVRVHRSPANVNVANAANLALGLARGRYVLRLDQDDIALPERLALQVDHLEREPSVHVLGGNMALFGDRAGVTRHPLDDAAIKANLLPAVGHFANPTVCLRRSFFERHRLRHRPEAPPADDYGLWVDAMIAGARFANLGQVLTRYRIHGGQNSRDLQATRAAVAPIRRRLLRHWFPDLAQAEVASMEPILHASSDVVVGVADARRGLAACERALSCRRNSVAGEDRGIVRRYIEARVAVWRALMEPRAGATRP